MNFKYVYDVFCSDATQTGNTNNAVYAGRYKVSPDYITGYGTFSPARVLESYFVNHCDPFITGVSLSNYSQLNVLLMIGEEYDASSSYITATGTTIYSGLTGSSEVHCINSVRQYDEPHSGLTAHNADSSIDFRYLTDWKQLDSSGNVNPKKIRRDEYEILSIFTQNGYYKKFQVNAYDDGNNLIATTNIINATSTIARIDCGVGVGNLNDYDSSIITSAITSYYVNGMNGGSSFGQTFQFIIDDDCVRYNTKRLCWLNKWGGYDYFTFKLIDRQFIERKTNEWQKQLPRPDWNIGDLSRVVLNVDANKKFIVTSDWVTDYESEFIQNLFTSPEIYLLDGTNKLPIIITEKTIEKGTNLNDVVTNYTFNFDYGWNMNLQRS